MKERVLFVDDDVHITRAMRTIFSEEAFEVVTAQSGREALSIMEAEKMAVVVSDEQMPGMSGTELLRQIRTRYPDTIRIMLTGYATLESVLAAINQAEVHRFLLKPCNFAELGKVVREALKKKEKRQETRRLLTVVGIQARLLDRIEEESPEVLLNIAASEGLAAAEEKPDTEESAHGIRYEILRFEERKQRLQAETSKTA